MKIDMINVDQIITAYEAKEVTNPIFFDSGTLPKEDGLFSYEIFGLIGTDERKNNVGWINLGGKYLNPVAYKSMKELDKNVDLCIQGSDYFKIEKGQLVPDENGETGLNFLYDNYENLKFRKNDSRIRNEKIDMLKNTPKDRIFTDKWPVIPAFYRDFNPNETSGEIQDTEEINDMYASILRSVDSISFNSFEFVANTTKYNIQNKLFEIYVKLTSGELSGKTGMMQRNILGKTVDNSTRSVISSPKINSNKWNEMQIEFGQLGVPLTQLITLFLPFFSKYIIDFIEIHKDAFQTATGTDEKELSLEEVYEQFDDKSIKNMLEFFIKDPNERFSPIYVNDRQGKRHKVKLFENTLGRTFTVIDLLYIAATEICEDKHVVYSRYPIENFRNVAPAKIKILTTVDTIPEITLDDIVLKDYPKVVHEYPVDEDVFIDTAIIHNSYAGALGADFDGDMISIRSLWTVEANKEANKLLNKKTNYLNYTGNSVRNLGNESNMLVCSQ
ncbi:viral RNA polymerase beta-prime subunit [Staphylococcus phage MarsHill]|nr:viral RNA polymerase beta-prime subunit [Staphylococcus phage MarsHill]